MVDEKPVLPLSGLLFPRIFQAFRLAIQPSKLAIAFAAVTVIGLTGWTMDQSRTVIVVGDFKLPMPRQSPTGLRYRHDATELDIYFIHGDPFLKNFIESRRTIGDRTGVFSTLSRFGAATFHTGLSGLFSLDLPKVGGSVADTLKALMWAFRWHTLYSIIFFTIAAVVLSVAGGALCRIAALQFVGAERPSRGQAVRFAEHKLISLLGGSIGPMVLFLLFGVPIILVGLAGNLPIVGELLTSLFLLLALIAACAATITLIGAMGGWGLMAPALAYEDSDGFDAINRAFSYVYAKPWHMGFYTLVAAVYGAVCYIFVRFFAFLLLWTTYRFLEMGFVRQNEKLHAIWPEPTLSNFLGPAGATPDTWYAWLSALLVRICVLGVIGLTVSFVVSFYFSANTIIYALMRHRVDGIPLEEVHTSSREVAATSPPFQTGPDPAASEPTTARNGGMRQESKTSG